MKSLHSLGLILLAIWLILAGLLPLLSLTFPASGTIMAVLALVAGVLILMNNLRMGRGAGLPANLGYLLLAIWLILTGLLPLLNIDFAGSGTILAILGIAAGVLLLLRR
jgi:hypothetical protein